jgi:hypothetical protein
MKKTIARRQFLRLLLMSGAAAGCRRIVPDEQPVPTPAVITATPPATLTFDLRFELENQAIDYGPHPEGCDRTTIQGGVYDTTGAGLPGITLHVWSDDTDQTSALTTGDDGMFLIDVADGLSEMTYYLQVVEQGGGVLLSDVVIAQALPSCDLNLIQVNFVARP